MNIGRKKELWILFHSKIRVVLFILSFCLAAYAYHALANLDYVNLLEESDYLSVEGAYEESEIRQENPLTPIFNDAQNREEAIHKLKNIKSERYVEASQIRNKIYDEIQLSGINSTNTDTLSNDRISMLDNFYKDLRFFSSTRWETFFLIFGDNQFPLMYLLLGALVLVSFPIMTVERTMRMKKILSNTRRGLKKLIWDKFFVLSGIFSLCALVPCAVYFIKNVLSSHESSLFKEKISTVMMRPYIVDPSMGLLFILTLFFYALAMFVLASTIVMISSVSSSSLQSLFGGLLIIIIIPFFLAQFDFLPLVFPSNLMAVVKHIPEELTGANISTHANIILRIVKHVLVAIFVIVGNLILTTRVVRAWEVH